MPTILLEQIIELLTGWKDSFFTWANAIGDKIASIKTNTDSLPDIENNTDDIKDNTAAVITPISNINSNVTSISSDVSTIKTDTGIIKNNASAIATSSGAAAAFAEDVANNTLEVKNKITTIASDTTQMRADSGSIRSDVSEIKNTLGLYLYNTIVTEDAEGIIASIDTDLQDYLQKALVEIPADANGISIINIYKRASNLWDEVWENGTFNTSTGANINSGPALSQIRSKNLIPIRSGVEYLFKPAISGAWFIFYDIDGNVVSNPSITRDTSTTISGNSVSINRDEKFTINDDSIVYCRFYMIGTYGSVYNNDISICYPSNLNKYEAFSGTNSSISFTSPITDGAEVDLLSGIVKINTSPVSYDSITPIAIRTFKGVNNIYSDIGDIDVTYRETLKHYLEKQQ